jgi:hypothetical protein
MKAFASVSLQSPMIPVKNSESLKISQVLFWKSFGAPPICSRDNDPFAMQNPPMACFNMNALSHSCWFSGINCMYIIEHRQRMYAGKFPSKQWCSILFCKWCSWPSPTAVFQKSALRVRTPPTTSYLMSSPNRLMFICETRTLNDLMASRTKRTRSSALRKMGSSSAPLKKESAEELAKPFEDRLPDVWGMPHLGKVDHERLQELRRQLPVPRQCELDRLRGRLNEGNQGFADLEQPRHFKEGADLRKK